jgi:hypothetical protein
MMRMKIIAPLTACGAVLWPYENAVSNCIPCRDIGMPLHAIAASEPLFRSNGIGRRLHRVLPSLSGKPLAKCNPVRKANPG